MDWHPAWVATAKVALVSGAIWVAYVVRFVVGRRQGGRDDIKQTYTAAFGVILAWIATSALAIWLVGLNCFILGVLLLVIILGTVSSHCSSQTTKANVLNFRVANVLPGKAPGGLGSLAEALFTQSGSKGDVEPPLPSSASTSAANITRGGCEVRKVPKPEVTSLIHCTA